MKYRNLNTDDVIDADEQLAVRLEALDNWRAVRDDDDQDYEYTVADIGENLRSLTSEQRNLIREALAEFADADQVQAVEPPATGDGTQPFDPNAATVEQVNAYLAAADPAERVRVFTAEADGQGRKGILSGPHAETAD